MPAYHFDEWTEISPGLWVKGTLPEPPFRVSMRSNDVWLDNRLPVLPEDDGDEDDPQTPLPPTGEEDNA